MSEGIETHTAEDGITYQRYGRSEDPRWHPVTDTEAVVRNRQGAWSGPECPWCELGSEMTQGGTVVESDDNYDVFVCRFGHDLRVPHNRDDLT